MNQNNLFAYMASVVSQLKEERRMGTAHVYQSTLRRVMEFEGEETLDFKDLTPAWLKSFQDHLLDSRLQWNTVSTYMRMLRAIYFRAVDDGVAQPVGGAGAIRQAGAEGRVDAAEVDALIQARLAARAGKDWAESDRVRDQLTAMGVVLEDGKGGTTWRLADQA